MAYSSTNPPCLMTSGSFGGQSLRMWGYKSTHTLAEVAASSFFSNGHALGLKVGDGLFTVTVSTAGAYTDFGLGVISSVSTGAGATATYLATST